MADVVSGIHARTDLYIPSTLELAPNKPEVAIAIIKKFSNQYRDSMGMDLTLMGNSMGVSADTYTCFQESWYWKPIVAAASVSASQAGGTQAITIEVDDDNRFFPKVGHIIVYKGVGNIQGIITALNVTTPTAPVITVQAASGVTLPAVTEGDEIMISTNAWGEGTGQPTPSVKTYDQLTFYLQIIKDKFGITGTQITNSAWIDISEYGGKFNFYNVGVADLDARMFRQEEGALLINDGSTYTVSSATGLVDGEGASTVQTTKGIIPLLRTYGGVDATVTASNWTVTDLDDIDDYLKTQGDTSPVVMGYVGGSMARRISSQLGTLQGYHDATDTLTQYIGGMGYDEQSAKARAVNMRFMEYRNINRVYAFRELGSFSDPNGFGATGYKFREYSMWFPLSNVKDGKTGAVTPLVTLIHKEKDGYSRRRETFTMQGAGGNAAMYNMELDKKIVNMRSHIGLVMGAPNLGYITTAGE
jgi:hypothetical protein